MVGTPFHLVYSSERVLGRSAGADTLVIPLSGASVPMSLTRIDLQIEVAGQMITKSFPPAPNQSDTFVWNGKDAYGRAVQGEVPAVVRIGYVYPVVFVQPANQIRSFGVPSETGVAVSIDEARDEVTLWLEEDESVGMWDARGQGLGAWTLDAHHLYDPIAHVLYLGTGDRVSAQVITQVITTFAGGDVCTLPGCGDGSPATQAYLGGANGLAVGPDGSVYVDASRIRRVGPDGIISTVAGGGSCGSPGCGDGGPATSAILDNPRGLTLGSDGSLYFIDVFNNGGSRIRRVGPDGIVTTVAGTGTVGFRGDGGPALDAQFNTPESVAIGPDRTLYIADEANQRVRAVGPDGTIRTAAGTGTAGFGGDGGPAVSAELSFPAGVAVGPDGSLYIADHNNGRVRRVGLDGRITTVAGNGVRAFGGDGGPATDAWLYGPEDVAVGLDGSLLIADPENNPSVVRHVGTDGIITTWAGGAHCPSMVCVAPPCPLTCGDGGPPTKTQLYPGRVLFAPDGTSYVADGLVGVVRKLGPPLPGYGVSDLLIASQDGRQLYVFDATGRHLSTLDAYTGATRYQFGYDAAGRLASATDGDGNVTTVMHDASGNPTAIVAPGGQRTTLTVDAHGYLASIADPAGDTIRLASSADGLLTTLTDARGGAHQFQYDTVGLLTQDTDPAGGTTTLMQHSTPMSSLATTTSGLGRVRTYESDIVPTGGVEQVITNPSGAKLVATEGSDGNEALTYPDGRQVTMGLGPDPRFGMQAPVLATLTETMPSGLVQTITNQRVATLADPNDLLSLTTLTTTIIRNGATSTAVYDAATRTLTTTSAAGRKRVAVLDAQGRAAQLSLAPGLAPIVLTRDAHGRPLTLQQGAQSSTYAYDVQNREISRTDAAGEKTQYAYDAADRVIELTTPTGRVFHFAYDADGNRTQVTMPSGAIHALTYTPIDLSASYTPPGNPPYGWTYDADRDLTQYTLPGGRALMHGYDAGGRPTGMTSPEAAVAFSYASGDPTDRVSAVTWTATGGTPTAELAFTYDGTQPTGAAWTGAVQGQYHYTYNTSLEPTALDLTSGADTVHTAMTWDVDGRVTGYGPFTLARAGPGGAISGIGDGTGILTLGYDALGRVDGRTYTVATQPTYTAALTYNTVGQIAQKVESVLGGASRSFTYGYDADGQLAQVTEDGLVTEAYDYDANGNRTSRTLSGITTAATYDSQDRITQQGSVTYQVSPDGVVVQRGATTSFRYDTAGELLAATVGSQTITYAYDGLGRRVSRTDATGTSQYFYGDPASPLEITAYRNAAGTLSTYYYDEAGLLIALRQGAATYYVATDQVGTPRAVADATGAAVEQRTYDAFGNLTSDTNAGFDLPIGFAGGLADPVTGLVRFGFRDYDPAAGRWTARDPALYRGGFNLYLYVANDPIALRDPLGLLCVGGSAYLGVGGGGQVCVTDNGLSICAESGIGIGTSVGVSAAPGENDPGNPGAGLANDTSGVADTILDAEVGCGPLTFGVQGMPKPCTPNCTIYLGPAAIDCVTGNTSANVNVLPECSIGAKATLQSCIRHLF